MKYHYFVMCQHYNGDEPPSTVSARLIL